MQTSEPTRTVPASDPFGVGRFLPESMRASPTEASVVVSVHETCARCAEYVDQLAAMAAEFRVWDAGLRVVSRAAEPALMIADRYGQIFYSFHGGSSHALPAAGVVAEALKFIGTLFPE